MRARSISDEPTMLGPLSQAEAAHDQDFQEWLDDPIVRLSSEEPSDGPRLNDRMFAVTKRYGLRNRRDLYIAGSDAIDDIRNVGAVLIASVHQQLDIEQPYQMRWRPAPGYEDIATVSRDLSDVTTFVLSHRYDLLGMYAVGSRDFTDKSVQDVVDIDPRTDYRGLHSAEQMCRDDLQVVARVFVRHYWEAKQALSANSRV